MNRRLVLKQLAVATAAAWFLPSCVTDTKKLSIALNNLKISSEDEELMASLADTIIPETDTPGAKTVEAHLFALMMVDDCMSKTDQEKYLQGMRNFNSAIEQIAGNSFESLSPEERLQALIKLEDGGDSLSDDIKTFYFRSKGYIIQGYTQSQHFLTEVQPYVLVPGPDFKGCVSSNPQAV